ncbi:hypothetical protein HN51_069455 [Arachis hypogaea]|uniref:Peptidase metallopeptidase domain-containing protein n=1 Tax=Arachis hypogaea TaxID=3818 RepID=A0A444Z632_ARAHY|nr:metalloendoproteinase 1-like [Arachis ipaensis]XP_025654494.1 metalloendoproteinase 1 [Arachis hypogaea]QHO11722.1 Metalloendoproteinase [Arachis hypogaea]RYR09632.1 hypothetical protein Ahy_B05g078010 [Arachis hypogaea]
MSSLIFLLILLVSLPPLLAVKAAVPILPTPQVSALNKGLKDLQVASSQPNITATKSLQIYDGIKKPPTPKPKIHNFEFNVTNQSSVPYYSAPAGAPPQKIEGLHLVKEYLYTYGYIQNNSSSGNFTDLMDENMVSTIKDYQRFFNLDTTGDIDNDTYQQILLPRCGVPDMNVTYDLPVNFSWPQGTLLFANSTKILTYGFDPRYNVQPKIANVFKDSLQRWPDAIGILNFIETTFKDANIKIVFMDLSNNETIGDEFGAALYEGSSFGIMVMDSSKTWVLPNVKTMQWEEGEVDLESVVMHQIGHLLGLSHSTDDSESVMFPSVVASQQRKVELSQDDQVQIQQLYFPGKPSNEHSNSQHGVETGRGFILASLFLGFASMVLF